MIFKRELEKQISELEIYNKKLLQSDIDKQNKIVLLSQKVNDLQKENAELEAEKGCKSCTKFAEVQLTKAKEIIREYSKWECEYCDYKRNQDYVIIHCSQCQKYSLHKKAEQFLKIVRKKNEKDQRV